MRLISRLRRAVAGFLFLASSMHAGVIVVSYSSPYTQPIVTGGVDIPLSFQQFDPSLGTLESVGLEDSFLLTSTASQSGFWVFDNCVPDTGSSPNPNTATFAGITGTTKSVQATDTTDFSNILDSTTCGNTVSTTPASSSFDVTSLLTGGAMSGYIGLSRIGLNTHLDGGDGGGSVSGTSTVTYTYDTAVPEPETLLMAGAGFAMLACARRRRV